MNELAFYNQQFEKYKKYDHHRSEGKDLNLDSAEGYFEYLVKSYSDLEGTLVDLGCGDGYFTSKLAELNGKVVGIEPSSLINAANELLETKKLSNLKFLKEDAYKLSLADESANLVISRRGPDPENEVHRVLKDEGLFIFITIGEMDCFSLKKLVGRGQHFGNRGKVSEELKVKFLTAGFTDVLCKDFFYLDIFKSGGDLKEFLHQVPIFDNFSKSDYPFVDAFSKNHKDNNIKLDSHRVVLLARKSAYKAVKSNS